MNAVKTEKQYQHELLENLENIGYTIRQATTDYSQTYAMDGGMLMRFLWDTQRDEMTQLDDMYHEKLEQVIVKKINAETSRKERSLLDVLRHGVEIAHIPLTLMYTKPATSFNPELLEKYQGNRFSAMEEVPVKGKKKANSQADGRDRVDVVLFLNGLAIIAFELKCNAAGQTYKDAIRQFREDRDPLDRLFLFKQGTVVNFAMDLEQVHMTTRLDKEKTVFLPFNRGRGSGVDAGAGNPPMAEDGDYPVSYMWEDILQKDTVLELLGRFIFLERKEKVVAGRKKRTETLIFPRYHQLDVVRKVLADVQVHHSSQNYLIQHSAGSGKTNSIAWLAHRLTSLHDAEDQIIFEQVVIITDRVVVDRQLQEAVMGMEHKSGLIEVMDDRRNSADLAWALSGHTKIIATTIQKFPYIVDQVRGLSSRRFAIIIDEAHSSTAGKDMAAVSAALSTEEGDAEDVVTAAYAKHGKAPNVSFFAFTATPKPTTLQLFGRDNVHGMKEAFHIYSMKQAIEEGFILDVLQNYVEYKTFCQLNKSIEEDPQCKTREAKRQIARFIALHDTNVAQRVEIIIEHFRTSVMGQLGGQAKAMVVTSSRQEAVKYREAFDQYIRRKEYTGLRALVAFSGKVQLPGDETEYTEAGMNGFPEGQLPAQFDGKLYQVLLVANKYQTGFDQPKLCAMYILKKLHGVNAVQTLSRLNRTCLPYTKQTFILDFKNTYEDMVKAFAPYYTTTQLSSSVTPQAIYELEAKIDGYYLFDMDEIERVYDVLHSGDKKRMKMVISIFNRVKGRLVEKKYTPSQQGEAVKTMKNFTRFYVFLIQATCFEDEELEKKYCFIDALLPYLQMGDPGNGFDLAGKITATGFAQKKGETHTGGPIPSDPVVRLPVADSFSLPDDKKERLSEIIAKINSSLGKAYDEDVVMKSMLQIKDILMKSEKLRQSAKSNTEKDFEYTYFQNIDDALIDGLQQNQDFFTLLLNNDAAKKEVLGIFAGEIYKHLRSDEGKRRYDVSPDSGIRVAENRMD